MTFFLQLFQSLIRVALNSVCIYSIWFSTISCMVHALKMEGGKYCFQLGSFSGIKVAPVIAASRHLSSHHQSPEDIPELQERKEKQYFAQQYLIPEKGKVYAKRPFKFLCKEGKYYVWCSCGYSKTQPFCDGTHKNQHLRIQLRPVVFVPKETREYWFCNCKQTKNRPFCDGTHNCEEVQQAPSTIRY